MKTREGKGTSDTYCVAKYGNKWVRTRTILNSLRPKYNEQYTWEVFDPATVLTVGVFDNGQLGEKGPNGNNKDLKIGKVRIRIFLPLKQVGFTPIPTRYWFFTLPVLKRWEDCI